MYLFLLKAVLSRAIESACVANSIIQYLIMYPSGRFSTSHAFALDKVE